MSLDRIPPDNSEHDEYDEFRDQYEESEPVPGGRNKGGAGRAFLTIIGVIGAVVVLAVIGLVIYFFVSKGQLTNQFQEEAAKINAENTKIAMEATQTSVEELSQMTQKAILPPTWTPTKLVTTASAPSATPRPTNTTVPTSTVDPAQARTATVVAFLTQSARSTSGTSGTQIAQVSPTATKKTTLGARTPTTTSFRTPTALPTTGFADDVGLPGMLGLAFALVIIVFLSRRIRLTAHR